MMGHTEMLDRQKVENLIRNFLRVANRKGIEKIGPKIMDTFFGYGTEKEAVRKQLLGWVNTNLDGRHKKAIPAATSLYEYLFGRIDGVSPRISNKTNPTRRVSWPLIELAQKPEVNQKSNFVSAANALTTENLKNNFDDSARNAPSRHNAGLKYFVGHSGIPSGNTDSNRVEQHLAIALSNRLKAGNELSTNSELVRLFDYEVPLTAKQAAHGLGNIDLLGITANGVLDVIELKIGKGTSSETPLRALLQALSYSSIVLPNIDDIAEEVLANFNLQVKSQNRR